MRGCIFLLGKNIDHKRLVRLAQTRGQFVAANFLFGNLHNGIKITAFVLVAQTRSFLA